MGVLEKLRSAFGETEEPVYSYVCGECQSRFQSVEHNPNFTDCPQCGSERVHSAV